MGDPNILRFLAAGTAIGGGIIESDASNTAGEVARIQAETRAKVAEEQAKRAIEAGGYEASRVLARGREVMGAQRARGAASGLDLTGGSISQIIGETQAGSELDALTVRNNAYLSALGYNVEAEGHRAGGDISRIETKQRGRKALFGAGQRAFDYLKDVKF